MTAKKNEALGKQGAHCDKQLQEISYHNRLHAVDVLSLTWIAIAFLYLALNPLIEGIHYD